MVVLLVSELEYKMSNNQLIQTLQPFAAAVIGILVTFMSFLPMQLEESALQPPKCPQCKAE